VLILRNAWPTLSTATNVCARSATADETVNIVSEIDQIWNLIIIVYHGSIFFFKENNGAIVGLVLGIVIPVVVLIIVGASLAFYFCYYKPRQESTALEFDPKSSSYMSSNNLRSNSNNQLNLN
jgi:hypothetical protein